MKISSVSRKNTLLKIAIIKFINKSANCGFFRQFLQLQVNRTNLAKRNNFKLTLRKTKTILKQYETRLKPI